MHRPNHLGSISVSIVDDDESVLDAVRLVLEDHGWQVKTYSTGEAFIADQTEHNVDCVILDPHLPGISGGEVAHRLGTEHSHIPIIGLTARPDSKLAIELKHAGTNVMLTKPVTVEELVDHIRLLTNSDGTEH